MTFENRWWLHAGIETAFRPTHALRLSLAPSYTDSQTDIQYVTQESYGSQARYLFAHMDRETATLTMRIDYCLTPNLTLQYYGQAYGSAASHDGFRRITDPRAGRYADRFEILAAGEAPDAQIRYAAEDDTYRVDEDRDGNEDYAFDDPDFNYREFNSNLVLRWEYRPGSLLYLVWSQGRAGATGEGGFDAGQSAEELFAIHPHNVFLVKISRWFNW